MTSGAARSAISSSLGLAVLFAIVEPARADPSGVRLSFGSTDPSTQIIVAWNTEAASDSVVEYGTSPALGLRATGSSTSTESVLGFVHEVSIGGLAPDTIYYYRAGGADGFSGVHQLRTAPRADPSCGTFRFVALGDGRADLNGQGPSDAWGEIADEARFNADPSFLLHSGDIVKSGVVADEWRAWLEVSEAVTPFVPFMPAVGNHDVLASGLGRAVDARSYLALFALPTNDVTGQEDAYFFTYANAIFVAISTSTFDTGATPFADQAAWLDRVLTDHPRLWKFVYFHHPTYTSADNVPILSSLFPANELGQNPALVPVFERHAVDFVIMGHHHMYERFEPLLHTSDWTVGRPDPAGVNYLITGGAGAPGYTDVVVGLACGSAKDPGSVACSSKFHYVSFSIEDERLRLETWTTSRQAQGQSAGNRQLIDEHEIVKSLPPGGCSPPVHDGGVAEADAVVEMDARLAPDAEGAFDAPSPEDAALADARERDGGTSSTSEPRPDAPASDDSSRAQPGAGTCACSIRAEGPRSLGFGSIGIWVLVCLVYRLRNKRC